MTLFSSPRMLRLGLCLGLLCYGMSLGVSLLQSLLPSLYYLSMLLFLPTELDPSTYAHSALTYLLGGHLLLHKAISSEELCGAIPLSQIQMNSDVPTPQLPEYLFPTLISCPVAALSITVSTVQSDGPPNPVQWILIKFLISPSSQLPQDFPALFIQWTENSPGISCRELFSTCLLPQTLLPLLSRTRCFNYVYMYSSLLVPGRCPLNKG